MRPVPRLLAALAGLLLAAPVLAHDYPTADRVLYVQECMDEHPGPAFEMVHKCSCTIDRLARDLSYDDFVTLSTESKATSIGGERGNVIRDTESVQKDIRRFRALQTEAKKACFIRIDSR
ncbi:MAG TPA: hypothetical protein VLI72_13920 [Methylibium sp.]|nr:hypothetical protein [Methylibium sp.]